MVTEVVIKTWPYKDGKKICAFFNETGLYAKIYAGTEKEECSIPCDDIVLPREIQENPVFLPYFLQDTHIHLTQYNDGDYKLYISSRLRGGGLLDFCCSIAQIALGVALHDPQTTPYWLGLCAGLVNSGINGALYALQRKQNFEEGYMRQSVSGFATGAILGGITSAIHHPTQSMIPVTVNATTTVAKTSEIVITAAGGATAQAISHWVSDKKIDPQKICISAITTGSTAFMLGQIPLLSPSAQFKTQTAITRNSALLRSSILSVASHHGTETTTMKLRQWLNISDKAQEKSLKKTQEENEKLSHELDRRNEKNTEYLLAQATRQKELDAITREQALEIERLAAILRTDANTTTTTKTDNKQNISTSTRQLHPRPTSELLISIASSPIFLEGKATSRKQQQRMLEQNNQVIEEILSENDLVTTQEEKSIQEFNQRMANQPKGYGT